MFFDQEAVLFDYPVFDQTGLTPNEVEQLLPLFESPQTVSPNSGSEGSNRTVYSEDERKRRRMRSNRESARRSRWRKKRHLEKLTEQANGLKVENRELKRQLGYALNQCNVLWRENDRLISESVALRATLSDLCYTVVAMQAMQQQPQ